MTYQNTTVQAAYMREWRRKHRQSERNRVLKWNQNRKDLAYKKLGNRCASSTCSWKNVDGTFGCTDRRCLNVDHINGDGAVERKFAQSTLYKLVLNDTENRYQLLCCNCNWIKRHERGEASGRPKESIG